MDLSLVNNRKKALKLAARPNFKHCTIFDETLVAIPMKQTKLVFDKPVYCGMSILDISKTMMYEFVGLRAKLYSYKIFEGSEARPSGPKEEKKCKGTKKAVTKKNITHDDCKECLFSENMQMR